MITDINAKLATGAGNFLRPRLQTVMGSTLVNGANSTMKLVGETCFMRNQANGLAAEFTGALQAADADNRTQGTFDAGAAAGTINNGTNFVLRGSHVTAIGGTDYVEQTSYEFYIPIYSGIIGVLQPDKKLIPMNLMPLEVEFTLNPHALYSNLAAGSR